MNRISIFLALLLFTASSCSKRKAENFSTYKILTFGMQNSSIEFSKQTTAIMMQLKKEIADPITSERASIWHIKGEMIRSKTTEIIEYIDSLKSDLMKEARDKSENPNLKHAYKEDDVNAVWNLFNKNGKGKELEVKIQEYESSMLGIDTQVYSVFKKSIANDIELPLLPENKNKSFSESFLTNIPTIAALAVLAKLQNSIRIVELHLILFCSGQVPR